MQTYHLVNPSVSRSLPPPEQRKDPSSESVTVMEGRKRGFSALEPENQDAEGNIVTARPAKKKNKFDENDDGCERDGKSNILSGAEPTKPMEKKKKRKAFDKKRRSSESDHSEVKSRKESSFMKFDIQAPSFSSRSSILPEFHIGVFSCLTSTEISARVAAAEALVTELYDVQRAYDHVDKKEISEGAFQLEAEKDDGLNDCAPSVRYAVRRLIRGVSSSRECARQGFTLGLTMLIGRIAAIRVDSFLGLVSVLLEISSSMKGQEARDCLLGRLFAYGALVRSGRLKEEWTLDKDTPYIKEFVSHIISLALKKQYLQEPAVSVLLELVEQLPEDGLLNHVLGASKLQDWFKEAVDKENPDALLLALKLQEKISVHVKIDSILACPFRANEFFSPDHLSSLSACLKASTFCQPRVHTVWPILVKTLLPDAVLQDENNLSSLSSNMKHKKSHLSSLEDASRNVRSFCEYVIDGCLLLSSHDRKHLAFDVVLLMLDRIPASFIQITLSSKIVQCLMDVLASKDSWLHKVAQHFLRELSDWAQDHDSRRIFVIVALQKHSNGRFDSMTRTRTVKDLMSGFKTESGCMLFIQSLTRIFLDNDNASEEPSDQSQTTDDNSELGSSKENDPFGLTGKSDFLKTWIIDSLPSVLKNTKLDLDSKFRVQKEILKFLAVQGLFSASLGSEVTSFELQEKFQWPKIASSTALCRMCIEQVQVLLSDAHKASASSVSSLDQADLGSYFTRFVSTLHSIPSVSFFRPLTKDEEEAVRSLQVMESGLFKEELNYGDKTDHNRVRALRYLLIQLLLQVLLQPGEFLEAVSELVICCKKAFGTFDIVDNFEQEEMDNEETPALMDVLVDTLLSMLPQSAAPLRSAIELVFKYFCEDVTDGGLLQMLRVIKQDLKPARHHDNDEDDDDEDFLGIEEGGESDEANLTGTAESEERAESEVGNGGKEQDDEFTHDSDESDGGMDDDAMFRMDSYLARLFNERKNQAGAETTQSQLVLFKLRVLSLLEIYLHENAGKRQVLIVCSHLVLAFCNPHIIGDSEHLGQRIWGILQKKVFKAKQHPVCGSVDFPTLISLLEKSMKLASKPVRRKNSSIKQSVSWNWHRMVNSMAEASVFWVLKIIGPGKPRKLMIQRVCAIFRAALVNYFESKKLQMKSDLLKEIFRRRPWIGHSMFGFLLRKCAFARYEFRRVDALGLIMDIIKSKQNTPSDGHEDAMLFMKSHMYELHNTIKELAMNMPKKQSRRSAVKKSCLHISQIICDLDLGETFLKIFSVAVLETCRSQFGAQFLVLQQGEPSS